MRIEATIGGQAVVWQNDRRAKMRAEIALGMPWEQISANMEVSSAIKEQAFYSGFTYPDGRPMPEDVIDALAASDADGMKAFILSMAAEGKPGPLAKAPSPGNSGSGARSASRLPTTGKPKIGKSKKSPKAGTTTSAKGKSKA